jgi:hypothetical protein
MSSLALEVDSRLRVSGLPCQEEEREVELAGVCERAESAYRDAVVAGLSASDVTAEMTTATSQSTGTVSSAALAGTWAATNEPFVVRFTPDGNFSMDGDGSVDDGVYVEGTYP